MLKIQTKFLQQLSSQNRYHCNQNVSAGVISRTDNCTFEGVIKMIDNEMNITSS